MTRPVYTGLLWMTWASVATRLTALQLWGPTSMNEAWIAFSRQQRVLREKLPLPSLLTYAGSTNMPSMNRPKFQAEFEYGVEIDFSVDGVPVSWADTTNNKSSHRFWGDEDYKIAIPAAKSKNWSSLSTTSAISQDNELIAVSQRDYTATDGVGPISIFHIVTRELRAQFCAPPDGCYKLFFARCDPNDEASTYTLIVQTSERRERCLVFYNLDANGSRIGTAIQPLQVDDLANKALETIAPAIASSHDLPASTALLATVKTSFTRALETLSAELEISNLQVLKGALPSIQANEPPIPYLLYYSNNETTQNGMRPPRDLPHIIIYDLASKTQKHSLAGHTDIVTWSEFSPDGRTIASASWDGTFRFWNAETGICEHVVGPTGGQNGGGSWSPDSKFVVLKGMERSEDEKLHRFVAVYSRDSGEEAVRFKEDVGRLNTVRALDWSGDGRDVAICSERSVYIWRPFEGDAIVSRFKVGNKKQMHEHFVGGWAGARSAQWVDGDRLLILSTGDETIEVWDRVGNVKWRFQRPTGLVTSSQGDGVYWLEKSRTLVSLDGDECLRFWQL